MKRTLLRATLAVLLLLGGGHLATAQRPAPAGNPARAEIRAYYQANVLPVVREQRRKLEAQLSTDDKAQLAAYRTQLRDLRQQGRALRQSLPPAPAPGATRPALTDAQREQAQQLRAASHAIMLSVHQLAQKYTVQIQQLTQEIQPQQDKWRADLSALRAPSATPEPTEKPGRKDAGHHARGLAGLGRPVRFLLLDPNAPAPVSAESAPAGSTLFPNPAVGTSQLDYTVKKAGPVTVEVLDGRGTVLRTLVQGEAQDKGPHSVAANVADLPAGTYFYKITTRSGVETKRFVKQ